MLLSTQAVILSAALVLAMILNLALKPAFSVRISTVILVIVLLGGLLYYGAGYMEVTGDLLLTVLRTPVFVFRMFIGINELAAISGSRLVSTPAGLFVFWLLHLFAFYSTASVTMNTLGAEALRQLRFFLSRRGDLTLIYGINDKSIALGRECLAAGGNSVVFLCESASDETVGDLNYAGMSVLVGPSAVACEKRIMRRLHIGRRKVTVYALNEEEDRNLYFALNLKDALEQAGIPAENTRVTLPGAEDIIAAMLQVSEERYGYGFVNVFDSSVLSARALIRTCPPWESLTFDPDGRAKEDYECLIVGFGSHGQATLKQLVMNGQFAGSTFRATVFSPKFEQESGYLTADSPALLENYEIRSFAADARSCEFYRYVESRLSTLKLIAVCTGDEEFNREISDNLMLYLKRRRAENICVVRCGDDGVRYQESVGSPILTTDIYTLAFLSAEDADRSAILLNANYDSSDRSDWEKWIACDSFSKMSSRASADFQPAFIRASGTSREEMLAGTWNPSERMLQALGETEHLRWNAFHFAMGYRTMSEEEFQANAAVWRRCQAEGIPCPIRLSKNPQARTHACLIPWEALDELSRRESEITGQNVNYKQYDIDNVLALPRLLRAEEEKTAK